MSGLENTNAVIVVFAMAGCGACEDYLPRLLYQVDSYRKLGYPFVLYDLGMKLKPGQIPVCVYDATSTDPGIVELADQHKVSGLPTTLLLLKHGRPGRWEGAQSDQEIYSILSLATVSNR